MRLYAGSPHIVRIQSPETHIPNRDTLWQPHSFRLAQHDKPTAHVYVCSHNISPRTTHTAQHTHTYTT